MYNENDIINKLRELLERQPAAFQKGRALNGGVGKQITVNINGKKIKALSYNVISPNEVTVFYDSTHDRYIAWQQPNRVLRSDKLIYRRTKPTPIKRTFGGKYLFKVFTRVVNSLLKVQGFGSDVEIENSDGYELVGLTNTGDGYVAIAKTGNTYLFDVDGEQKIKTVSNSDFGLTYVPYLDWYGGNIIYGFNQEFGATDNESYTFTNSGCINSVSQSGSITWSQFISQTSNEITIPYSISQTNYSFSEGGAGNVGQLVRKYDWQHNLFDETFNNYSYLTYDIDKSGRVLFNSLFSGSSFYISKIVNSQQNQSYTQQFITLDGDTLTVLNKKVLVNLDANITRTIDKIPRTQDFVNCDVDDFTGTVTRTAAFTPFNLSYCNPLHTIQVDFSDEWIRNYEHKYYVYSGKRIGYYVTFTWDRSQTGVPLSTTIQLVPHTFTNENEDTSISRWTIEIGESLANGGAYDRGYAWVYRITTPDGNVGNWTLFYDAWAVFKRDYEKFDWNYQGYLPVEGYIYATQPTITNITTFVNEWTNGNSLDKIYRNYINDEERNISSLESTCNVILNSNQQNIVLYWFYKNYYTTSTVSFHEYNVKRVPDGLGWNDVTTTIRPNTTTSDNFYYNPSTYTLGVKLNATFYEIKDFDETNGFNYGNRFYAYNTTTIPEPTLGNNTFSATFNIGLKYDNKGNYQNVIKRNKFNGTPPYERTYHPITVFNPIGLNIDLYWVSSGNVKKYTGTITNVNYTTSTNVTTNETIREYTELTVNLVEKEDISFVCHVNNYENGIFITSSNDYTRFLLEYVINNARQVNCYEEGDIFRIAIAKIPQQTDTTAYADIYEFDTVNKKFIRIGNDSSDLSAIDDTSNYISYHP